MRDGLSSHHHIHIRTHSHAPLNTPQHNQQHLGPEDRAFIFEAVSQACLEVSTHRHGCCVMQRCLDAATPNQRRQLVMEIGRNCLQLMQVRRPPFPLLLLLLLLTPSHPIHPHEPTNHLPQTKRQDPYGNYVVQYVLDRCSPEEIRPGMCPRARVCVCGWMDAWMNEWLRVSV